MYHTITDVMADYEDAMDAAGVDRDLQLSMEVVRDYCHAQTLRYEDLDRDTLLRTLTLATDPDLARSLYGQTAWLGRTQSGSYSIEDCRIEQIMAHIGARLTREQVVDYCLYDWPEGAEHQHWIDTAQPKAIASWVLDCAIGAGDISAQTANA